MHLKRFVPSVVNLEKDGFYLQAVIRGEQKQKHVPFIYMRNVEDGPYKLDISLTTGNNRCEKVEVKDATVKTGGIVYRLEPEQNVFKMESKEYTSSGSAGLKTNRVNEGRCRLRLPENLPYEMNSDYTVSLTFMIHPILKQLTFEKKFSLKQIKEKKSILKTYQDI